MNENECKGVPTAAELFEICLQMLAAIAEMQKNSDALAEEIRYLRADLKARR